MRTAYYFSLTYKDQGSVVLFVGPGIGTKGWGTFYRKPNGSLRRLLRSSLQMRETEELAQADLDAFAAQKGLERAGDFESPNPAQSTDVSETSPLAVTPEQEAAEASAAASPSPDPQAVAKELRLASLRVELQGLVEEEMGYKEWAAADAAHWRALLKDVDERKDDCLAAIHEEQRPIPNALPFEGPAEVTAEVKAEEGAPDLAGEPAMVPCEECVGAGMVGGEECKACMGTGKVIPTPSKAVKPPREVCACGHTAACHFTGEGNERPCCNCQEGKANTCVDDGGFRPPAYFGPWRSKWAEYDKDLQEHLKKEAADAT